MLAYPNLIGSPVASPAVPPVYSSAHASSSSSGIVVAPAPLDTIVGATAAVATTSAANFLERIMVTPNQVVERSPAIPADRGDSSTGF